MNPGPAISTLATSGLSPSASMMLCRDVAGFHFRGLGEAHRNVAGKIAVTGVARTLDRRFDVDIAVGSGRPQAGHLFQRFINKLDDSVLHLAVGSVSKSRQFYRVMSSCIGPSASRAQKSSIGSTSIDQRTRRAAGSFSKTGRSSRSTRCRFARSLLCRSSCAR